MENKWIMQPIMSVICHGYCSVCNSRHILIKRYSSLTAHRGLQRYDYKTNRPSNAADNSRLLLYNRSRGSCYQIPSPSHWDAAGFCVETKTASFLCLRSCLHLLHANITQGKIRGLVLLKYAA